MKKINISEYCIFPRVSDNQALDCVGLKIMENKNDNTRFKFFFPGNYFPQECYKDEKILIDEDELRNDIKNLLTAIYKSNLSQISNNQSIKTEDCPIDSIFWLMRDYIEKGYYIEKETIYKKENAGKIDWKKTIKDNNFLLDNNYNIVYSKFITKHIVNAETSLITFIHKYCVYSAIELFGFLYDLDLKSAEKPEIDEETTSKEFMLNILKNEYYKSFLDSKKELLLNMIKMIEWKTYGQSGFDMFSTTENKFKITFEYLVNENFSNVNELEQYYPLGKWSINGKDSDFTYLREDSIYDFSKNNKNDKGIFIIDAKYYKYAYYKQSNPNTLPKTSSVAKQIIYGEAVESKKSDYEVYNIFIIPFCSSDEKNIIYVGHAYGDWRKNDKTYDKIYTFKVDLRALVNNTLKKEDNIKFLNKIIEKYN